MALPVSVSPKPHGWYAYAPQYRYAARLYYCSIGYLLPIVVVIFSLKRILQHNIVVDELTWSGLPGVDEDFRRNANVKKL